ncbi:MAG: 3-hydroxyacyl-CoA dehydrogenase family protein [Deltaproteobacteria bacterium]|nr:3-hydroxyacyl-CoA dehydrogenase family protein [Deltaproteobacteria bacterium]
MAYRDAPPMATIERITVLGAGTMGHGIAQVAATAGYYVTLHDVAPERIDAAMRAVGQGLQKASEKGKITALAAAQALARIATASEAKEAVSDADIVIEAAPESLALKLDIFARLGEDAPPRAILATNTSSLPITEIASVVRDPARVLGMHFFNPVPVMELLEIVRAVRTSDETVAAALEVGRKLGKKTIVVRDSPGFATSRLGVAIAAEAMRMLEAQVASAEDIDTAMKLGYRHPMGPLELTDHVGLDVRLAVLEHLHREVGEQFRPPQILRQLVRAGKLGKKTGEGFYKW